MSDSLDGEAVLSDTASLETFLFLSFCDPLGKRLACIAKLYHNISFLFRSLTHVVARC